MSEVKLGNLEKQIAMHERSMGRKLSPEAIKVSGRAIDGEPYTPAERAPAVAQKGALSWGGGRPVSSPLEVRGSRGSNTLTSTPRADSGKSGVDEITRGEG